MNKPTVSIFSQAFKKWKSRDPFKESAVIAFNAIFAIPGLLVVVITWTSYFSLGLYFGLADLGSAYGTAGSIVLILIWSSYSAMIVLYGAEITKVYAERYIGEVPVSDIALKEEGRML